MSAPDDDRIRAPHPRLRPYLGDYVGYDISGVPAGTHLGLPSGALTFIVTIGEPLRQVDAGRFDVLLAGLHLRPTRIRHNGTMAGIQINVSPFASRALFALTAAELTHRTVGLGAVSRPLAAELHDRVNAAATWAERFAAIDAVLLRVLSDDASPRPEVGRAWAQIVRSRGRVPVGTLAEEVGWSRRHLSARFRAELGIGPKEAARVIRFDRARRMIAGNAGSTGRDESAGRADGAGNGASPTLAEVAAACGYADQSHLDRDFAAFAGTSPTAWLRSDPVAARGSSAELAAR